MDFAKYVEYGLLAVGAASVAALGLHGALLLVAPKTASTVDDKAVGVLGYVVKALGYAKKGLDFLALNLKK